jgi:Rhs element Vgr protein
MLPRPIIYWIFAISSRVLVFCFHHWRNDITASRRLPIAAEQRQFFIKVNGETLSRKQHLLAVTVSNTVNKVAWARLVYQDGAAARSDFPLSSSDIFIPGAELEILAGSNEEQDLLFKGRVIKHALKVRDQQAPQLIVECRHVSCKMTIVRQNRYFYDMADSDIIEQLFSAADIGIDIDATTVTHPQQVQYQATDWDYCLMRAEANGLLVFTDGETVSVKPPTLGEPVISLLFGATVQEADLRIDSRYQFNGVKAVSWDSSHQELVEEQGEDPGFQQPGNLNSASLADAFGLEEALQHPQLSADEARQWADAQWLYSQINRITGRIRCDGLGGVKPGDTVTLEGMGDRFNGEAFITAVRHEFDLVQGWRSHLQFGGVSSLSKNDQPHAEKAAGLLAAVSGLQIGIVVSNEDPDGEFRIKVKMPLVNNDDEGIWARVISLDAGDQRGFFFRPEVGDEVVLGFFADDPRQAVVLGMLHSSAKPAPLQPSDDNHEKCYQSRSGMKLTFDDEKVLLKLETPGGNGIFLDEDQQAINITDQHGNSIKLDSEGITLESTKAVNVRADTDITLESGASLACKSGAEIKLEGAAGAELSSSGICKVKGSLVQIN